MIFHGNSNDNPIYFMANESIKLYLSGWVVLILQKRCKLDLLGLISMALLIQLVLFQWVLSSFLQACSRHNQAKVQIKITLAFYKTKLIGRSFPSREKLSYRNMAGPMEICNFSLKIFLSIFPKYICNWVRKCWNKWMMRNLVIMKARSSSEKKFYFLA